MSASLVQTIGRGTIWTSVGSIGVKIAGLLATFTTLHRLSVYEYGLTELSISILPLFSIFILPGVASVVQMDMSLAKAKEDLGKLKAFCNDFFLAQFTLSFIPWAVVFFGAGIIANYYNEGIATLFRIVSFSFIVSSFRSTALVLARTYLRFGLISLYGIVEELLKFAILFTGYFYFDLRTEAVLYAYVGCEVLALLLFSPAFFGIYRPLLKVPRVQKNTLIATLRDHGKWSLANSYLNNFANNIRLWIIKAFFGAEAVGLFALASSLYSHVVSLFQLGTVLGPIFPQYVANPKKFDRLVSKGVKYQVLGLIITGTLGAVVASFLVGRFFPQYLPALPFFYVMLLAIFANGVSVILTPLFFVFKAQRSLFFSTVFKTLSVVLLAPILLYFFGIEGIAIEFVLTTSLFALERYRALKKRYPPFKIEPRSIFSVDQEDYVIIGKFFPLIRKFIPYSPKP